MTFKPAEGEGGSDWEKAVLGILAAMLVLGILTVWQVSLFAPSFLVNGAIIIWFLLLILALLSWRHVLWAYLIEGLLGLGLIFATISQPEHLAIASSGTLLLPTFIIIVGNLLALLLAVTSLYVFGQRFQDRQHSIRTRNHRVHQDCAPDAPCRTQTGYRV